VDTTTWELFNENFSLSSEGFCSGSYQMFLCKSDFEKHFETKDKAFKVHALV